MWNHGVLPSDMDLLSKVGKHSVLIGIILTIVGFVGILFPLFTSLATVSFIAWLMLFGGITAGFMTAKANAKDWLGWLKSFLLIVTGILILVDPFTGIQALGLLLAIYFLFDSFASFALGSSMKPMSGWWLWLLNGVFSVILAVIFLTSWNSFATEAWLIGIFVGISLLMDGLTLLFLGKNIQKLDKEL